MSIRQWLRSITRRKDIDAKLVKSQLGNRFDNDSEILQEENVKTKLNSKKKRPKVKTRKKK